MQQDQQATINSFQAQRWFYFFIIVHLLFWTLIPVLIRYNLPLDSIEGTVWGHQLEWGYDKNPYLNAWLTALATHLDGQTGWMVYLFSQISVIACLWAVWQLAKQCLPPAYALVSVMALESIQYYNLHAIDFNDNTLELGLWALTAWYFYLALRKTTGKYPHWILTGLFAGLGMMAKYYTAALLAGMALFLFLNAENRKQLATLPPYAGLVAFLAVILPHTIWLFSHEFITVTYVFDRAASMPSWTNHLFFPAQFAWQQAQAFLPALVLFALLFIGSKPRLASQRWKLSAFDQAFLFYVGLGPILLTVLLSIVLGIKLRAGWGMPLLSLWGIILIATLQPDLDIKKLHRFIAAVFIVMGVILSGYSFSLLHSSTPSSANFPGREIAQTLTQEWHDTYHTPLTYVAGSRWLGGNVEFYSKDHPAVYMEWNHKRAPWINDAELQQKGAIFLWDVTDNETLPAEIQQRFPQLKPARVMEFSWHRDHGRLTPERIGVAILPPESPYKPDFH